MSEAPIEELKEFFKNKKELHYKKGESVIRAGDKPQGIYFIKRGYVRNYSISKDGEELTHIIYQPGDFFPLRWVFDATPSSHDYEAMIPASLSRCSKEELVTFLYKNPDILFELTHRIIIRSRDILQRMNYLALGNARQRVSSILAICAERFGKKESKGILIDIPLTHKDLAFLLGVTRETVSIAIKKIEKEKIITYKKRQIIICDMSRLIDTSLLEKE